MDLESLNSKQVEWLQGGPEGDVVVSSRVRLVRNTDGFPFVAHAADRERARIEELLRAKLSGLEDPSLNYFRLDRLSNLMLELLLERRLISPAMAETEGIRAVAFDDAERVSIMVNEVDHLCIETVRGGLNLEDAFQQVDRLDDLLGDEIPYAFSERYGFLTGSPMDTGTGLKATVMLQLPATVMQQEMDDAVRVVDEAGLALRGVYTEGAHGAGDFYQISNRATLGVTEQEIVSSVREAALQVAERERTVRSSLYTGHPEEFAERIRRADGLLRQAGALSAEEAHNFLSQVRLGRLMGVLEEGRPEDLNALFLLTLPAHLQTMEGRELDTTVRNERRAVYLKNRLATG